jgi:hypothetical protein
MPPAGLQIHSRLVGAACILLAATVAVVPQIFRGNSCGHDFGFHLFSWFETLSCWKQGVVYPHWTSSSNYGAGEPRFVFYPPLTWVLGAVLGRILPWHLAPIALTWLLLASTGLATRAFARLYLGEGAAIVAGCAALSSGYALFDAYERTAFGELAGGVSIPLLLLFALRSQRSEVRDQGAGVWSPGPALNGAAALAVVIAGAWLSNAPVGVMACYLLAAVALAAAALQRSWAPILRAAIAAPLGLALAAIYLVPAIVEQSWADLQKAASGLDERVESSWLFAHHADPVLEFHDGVLHRASIIVVVMIAVALAGMAVAIARKTLPAASSASGAIWLPLAIIPVGVLLLQFPVSMPIWNLLPKLRYLQFPWRWLVVVEAPMAVFFAAAVWPGSSARRWTRWCAAAGCIAIFLTLTCVAATEFFQPCDDQAAVAGELAAWNSGEGVAGTEEYEPPGADNGLVPTGLPGACLVNNPKTVLGVAPPIDAEQAADPDFEPPPRAWSEKQNSCDQVLPASPIRAKGGVEHFEVAAVTDHAGYLVLRLRSYPAWRVLVNGNPAGGMPRRADGLMAVPVPAGPVRLTVDWATTGAERVGRWISALAFLVILGLWTIERRCQHSWPK